jgi:AcrR family transcriptional regulator
MITNDQNEAINMLIEGTAKTDIARKLGVSRSSIYNWIDDADFKAELDRRIQQLTTFGTKIINTKIETAIEELWAFRNKTTNHKVKADILMHFIDRGIGKIPTKIETTTNEDKGIPLDKDTLAAEFDKEDNEDNNE